MIDAFGGGDVLQRHLGDLFHRLGDELAGGGLLVSMELISWISSTTLREL